MKDAEFEEFYNKHLHGTRCIGIPEEDNPSLYSIPHDMLVNAMEQYAQEMTKRHIKLKDQRIKELKEEIETLKELNQ
jgi:hypothetical protein